MPKSFLLISSLLLSQFTIALAGDTIWTRWYNGPANSDEMVCAVLTDNARNVIVVGSSPGTTTAFDIVVLKYSPTGDSLWCQRIAGPGYSNDIAKAAVIDDAGAIYVTATTGTFPNYNILTLKLNPDGSEAWRVSYEGSAGRNDEPVAIAVDAGHNVFVLGSETNADNVLDLVTIKYDASGNRVWATNYDGGSTDTPTDIALGPNGTIYVTGSSVVGSYTDYVTVKYTADGTEEWSIFYNGQGNAGDYAVAIAVDGTGNAYITGRSATQPPPAGHNNWVTLKYDSDGILQWEKTYTGTGRGAEPVGLALDQSALYVFGSVKNSVPNTDFGLIAYNLNTGDTIWVRLHNGSANKDDDPAMIVLQNGKIYIVGSSKDANNRSDYYWLRYSTSGVLEGAARYNSPFDNDDKGVAIAVDGANEVVITGVSFGGANPMNYDIVTVKYDSSAPGIVEAKALPATPVVLVRPNPAQGYTRLILAGTGQAHLRIFSSTGSQCQENSVLLPVDYRLDLRGLAQGVYFLEVRTENKIQTTKLVVE